MSSRVVSVNVAPVRVLEEKPRLVSAIDKMPSFGPVAVRDLGLEGDEVGDKKRHGGTFQAVYALGAEDLAHWGEQLGKPVRPGLFGENLTTDGIDLNSCVIGEQWLVGTARFQVSGVRIPCQNFSRWLALSKYDNEGWVERFTARGRPGVYLSVLQRGHVQGGDSLDVMDVPGHGLTAGTVFRALTTERALLPLLLEVDGLPAGYYDKAQAYVDRTSG